MRIGIEAQRIFREKKHGMDFVALELIKALQKIDTENQYFIFVKPDVDNGVLQESPNFKIVELAGGPYPYWEQVLLPKAAKKLKLDVLHCTSNTAPLYCSVPLVLTLHDIIYLEKLDFSKGTLYQRFGNLYRKLIVPRIFSKCRKIITVSEFEKETITRHFNSNDDRLLAIHNAAGTHFSERIDQSQIDLVSSEHRLDGRYTFFLGNTDPKKNVPNVMAALKHIKAQNKLDFRLVMPDYNKEHLVAVLTELGAMDLLDNIQLTGYVRNTDLPVFYKKAALFIYPSLRESFGIPILEAMGCGTPVLTSNVASMPEVAQDAAFFCDPFNSDDLANQWLKAINQEDEREEKIMTGKQRASQFSWIHTAEKVLDIYRKLN